VFRPEPSDTVHRLLVHATLLTLCFLCSTALRAARAVEFGPQGIVRQFCQADALGDRVTVAGWPTVAPLVEWPLEPAWDHVMLIAGYTVDPPRKVEGGALAVDVHYSVVGVLTALGLATETRVDHITYRVHAPDERGWQIIGPPPPPYLFGDRVDVAVMQRSLERGTSDYLPNSAFVWQMFRSAGWKVERERTPDLLTSDAFRVVDQPAVGDVVAYLRDTRPYHVGILESPDQVISSTLNGGVVRTALSAFPGDRQFLRLVDPSPPASQADGAQLSQAPGQRSGKVRRAAQAKRTPRKGSKVSTPRRAPTVAPPPKGY